jgi:hypothetical protein
MAIAIYFRLDGMTTDRYDQIMGRLDAAGAAAPAGRLYHAAFGEKDGLHVFDVWESQETFDAFGATLMPILGEFGVEPGQPMVAPVHNTMS